MGLLFLNSTSRCVDYAELPNPRCVRLVGNAEVDFAEENSNCFLANLLVDLKEILVSQYESLGFEGYVSWSWFGKCPTIDLFTDLAR